MTNHPKPSLEAKKAKDIIEMYATEIGCSDFHIPEFITGVKMADGSKEYKKILDDETESLATQLAIIHVKGIIEILEPLDKMFDTDQGCKFWNQVLILLQSDH